MGGNKFNNMETLETNGISFHPVSCLSQNRSQKHDPHCMPTISVHSKFIHYLLNVHNFILVHLTSNNNYHLIFDFRKEARAHNMRYTTVFLRILSFESKILAAIPCLRNICNSDLITDKILNFKDKVGN